MSCPIKDNDNHHLPEWPDEEPLFVAIRADLPQIVSPTLFCGPFLRAICREATHFVELLPETALDV
jgi:hypothetical protein